MSRLIAGGSFSIDGQTLTPSGDRVPTMTNGLCTLGSGGGEKIGGRDNEGECESMFGFGF